MKWQTFYIVLSHALAFLLGYTPAQERTFVVGLVSYALIVLFIYLAFQADRTMIRKKIEADANAKRESLLQKLLDEREVRFKDRKNLN